MFSWDHNAYYHPLLLRRLPPVCIEALDVGCGAGTFAAKLARRAGHVDALDRSPVMVEAARAVVPANVSCRVADVMTEPLPQAHYDAVTSVGVLHHLPLEPALERFAACLRPGGVLAAVTLPRVDLPRELPVEVATLVAQQAVGLVLTVGRRVLPGRTPLVPEPTHALMPVLDPVLSVREVRQRAAAVLPGVRVRRLMYWRYLLVWRKPS